MICRRLIQLPVLLAVVAALGGAVIPHSVRAQDLPQIEVKTDDVGTRLQVGGKDFMVLGVNWDYFPIGTNYSYSLWVQTDEFIKAALAREMPLLQGMGVNAIRVYSDIPPRWVQYIYEQFGIWSVVNHPMARYGFNLDGVWVPDTDYSNPRLREAVTEEILGQVDSFVNTPGVLMWLLGNENNYGLSWSSFEIEALPEGEQHRARARFLYSLYGEILRAIKKADPKRPVAIANGDLQYIDLIAEYCQGLDIMGSNVYRGISARDFFQVIKDKLGAAALFTEFGADAFNAKEMREDQESQCRMLIGQWQEIYEQSAGKGRVGNAIGGLTFQWTDGWWKYRQEENLDVHDTNASWPNGGYPDDYVEGQNNMNEEWWGLTAKGQPDDTGLYYVYPRAAYYALQQAYQLDPYGAATTLQAIRDHFAKINPVSATLQSRGDTASLLADSLKRVRISGIRAEFETYGTGGERISTPNSDAPSEERPSFRGFDTMQSFFVDVEAKPTEAVTGTISVNMLGNVPQNPIDQIFYEARGPSGFTFTNGDPVRPESLERVRIYNAGIAWDDPQFRLTGFYRQGHYHWQYDGDFFGLYREAFYGENVDIYNGETPVGFEIEGKRKFSGLTFAFGPELWWGANPTAMAKYTRQLGRFQTTVVYQEDITERGSRASTSSTVPRLPTRKATVHFNTRRGSLMLDIGGIWAGRSELDRGFQVVRNVDGEDQVYDDSVLEQDTFGAKAKLTYQKGRINWYAQAARHGVVAEGGGGDQTITFTGWHLKDSGSGNQNHVLSGLALQLGNFQVSPNFLWQKPIIAPIPLELIQDASSVARARSILTDPFSVRGNRETVAGEFLITYDPTPATWMWQWDGPIREDAGFAGSLGVVFRHQPTTLDAAIGILANGQRFAFPGGTPARDIWEVTGRVLSKINSSSRLVLNFFAGEGESRGSDPRLIDRYGLDARLTTGSMAFSGHAKFNDWGPYDYHKDFNLTFPVQLMADVAKTLGRPRWYGDPQTQIGARLTYRTLDAFSPRYCPDTFNDVNGDLMCDPLAPGDDGTEWEFRTYLHLAM